MRRQSLCAGNPHPTKAAAEKWIREYVKRGWNDVFGTSMDWQVTQEDIDEFSRECGGKFVFDEPRKLFE